ncbi:hypothetical protein ACFYYS_08660 [Streptomyces sp. NPDC002120]|uniref:effector-associated constant component EACC1 n=1 Tax=Streptomyces sp. NPDC002120 TaxID=3364631 RepID=UPI00369BA000
MLEIAVRIAETGDDEAALRSLLGWVHADETLAGTVRGRGAAEGPPVPGGMGGGFDLVQFAVSSGLSVGALVVSVLQWRASLRRPAAITLRHGGVEVLLDDRTAADPEAVRKIVEILEARVDDGAR